MKEIIQRVWFVMVPSYVTVLLQLLPALPAVFAMIFQNHMNVPRHVLKQYEVNVFNIK